MSSLYDLNEDQLSQIYEAHPAETQKWAAGRNKNLNAGQFKPLGPIGQTFDKRLRRAGTGNKRSEGVYSSPRLGWPRRWQGGSAEEAKEESGSTSTPGVTSGGVAHDFGSTGDRMLGAGIQTKYAHATPMGGQLLSGRPGLLGPKALPAHDPNIIDVEEIGTNLYGVK